MNRDTVLRILLAGLLAAGVLWFVTATEWVEAEVNEPSKNEAARNRYYATQATLRALGGQVVKQPNLDRMPPAGARLILLSRHWALFPDRPARLRQWVEGGGHLVVLGNAVEQKELKWLPVKSLMPKKSDDDDDDKVDRKPPRRNGPDVDCRTLVVPDALPSTYADKRAFEVCGIFPYHRHGAAAGHAATWALRGTVATELVRVAVGQGSVTVIDPADLLANSTVLRKDNALVMAAALQAQRGAQFWFVAEEARAPLLPWLWGEAWPALALALMALVLAAWRGAVRFGPIAAVAAHHRRSMTEQIAGTAQFLRKTGPAALLAAQARALREAAGRRVRHFERLAPAARAQAIANVTGLDAGAIARALDLTWRRSSGQLAADLELLETARRLLSPAGALDASRKNTSNRTIP